MSDSTPSIQLTWADLIIEGVKPEDASRWLAEWDWLVSGRVAPVFITKFGDWFLRRPDGSTQMLDVLEGTVKTVAQTPEEFQSLVNDQTWQEEHFLSLLVLRLHEQGTIPENHQCYAVAPHPALGGKLEPEFIMVMDISVWQTICSQTFHGKA
jgi:hypothetical protein